ncbi:MAG: type I-F CRISPR-associated protein Csy1 [Dechloromonas sp.]|nr:type I-F CRISPR-associated protein Csy1 [Dechloromonas sp.]
MTETSNSLAPPGSVAQVKAVIDVFLQERRQPKLDALKPEEDEKRQQLLLDYLPANWLPDAARRVSQIQQVTHAIKFTHPDARGSSLCVPGNPEAEDSLLGTHSVARSLASDVVGNAAALDVYKFLRLSVGDKTILDLAEMDDPNLAAAISDDPELAQSWMQSFASLAEPKGPASSNKLAKQVYWPLGERQYHLLAPLFPTSLVHVLWKRIRQDRFSDEAKAAREAKRNGTAHPHGYCEYPNIAIQNFGGTKPQNISQLNSERYGENFLLPSLPPTWVSPEVRAPYAVDSVFDRIFGSRKRVRELVRILLDFLVSVEHAGTNIRIRNKRAELAGLIRDEAMLYADELRDAVESKQLTAGWTQDPLCQLNLAEQCWLDPERANSDPDFASLRRRDDWPDEICRRFGNWLNARMTTSNTPMGAVEAAHWREVLEKEMRLMRLEVAEYE